MMVVAPDERNNNSSTKKRFDEIKNCEKCEICVIFTINQKPLVAMHVFVYIPSASDSDCIEIRKCNFARRPHVRVAFFFSAHSDECSLHAISERARKNLCLPIRIIRVRGDFACDFFLSVPGSQRWPYFSGRLGLRMWSEAWKCEIVFPALFRGRGGERAGAPSEWNARKRKKEN